VPELPSKPPPFAEITPLRENEPDEKNELLPTQTTVHVLAIVKE
jgi:hypothetical protein